MVSLRQYALMGIFLSVVYPMGEAGKSLRHNTDQFMGWKIVADSHADVARNATLSSATSAKDSRTKVAMLPEAEHELRMFMVFLCIGLTVAPPVLALVWSLLHTPPAKDEDAEPKYSLFQRIFQAHKNQKFASDAQLAVRGAVFALVTSFPFFVPRLRFVITSGFYSSAATVMFVYTLYKSVGETMQLAWQGVVGTLLAVANGVILRGFYPDTDSDFEAGVISTFGFMLALLTFKVDMNTRIFALSWHAYFAMSYFQGSSGFSDNFQINPTGIAVGALLQSGVGAGMAILATLLPYPIFALDTARDVATSLCSDLDSCWKEAIDAYTAESRQHVLVAKLKRDMTNLKADVMALQTHVDNAWWECFGFGKPQVVRGFLGTLDRPLREMYNKLCLLLHACGNSDFGEKHKKAIEPVKTHLKEICEESGKLMKLVTQYAADGVVGDDEKARLQESKEIVRSKVNELAKAYGALKHDKLDEDVLDENAFCVMCSAYGRLAIDIADSLDTPTHTPMTIRNPFNCAHLKDPLQRDLIFRNSLAFVLAFLLGRYGYGKVLPEYNSGIPGTVALLLSTTLGAGMTKNLNRLQGVVLGTILGQLAYAMVFDCSPLGIVSVAFFVFVWLTVSMFVYYNATQYSGVACLLAAFGVQAVLIGCGDEEYDPKDEALYHSIISVVVGILIQTVVDMTMSYKRASDEAFDAIIDALHCYRDAVSELFDTSKHTIKFKHEIMAKVNYAESMGIQANNEPRWFRTPWRQDLFHYCTDAMSRLRECICNLETALAENDGQAFNRDIEHPKEEFLVQFCEWTSVVHMHRDVTVYIGEVEEMFAIFKHEDDSDFLVKATENEKKGQGLRRLDSDIGCTAERDVIERHKKKMIKDFIDGEKKLPRKRKGQGFETLEDDVECDISYLVLCLSWQLNVLSSIKDEIRASS